MTTQREGLPPESLQTRRGSGRLSKATSLCPAQALLVLGLNDHPPPRTHLLFQATQQLEVIFIIHIILCITHLLCVLG